MDKLYQVVVHEKGARVSEYNIVNETIGSYHIHTMTGNKVVNKNEIDTLITRSVNLYFTYCTKDHVEYFIEKGRLRVVAALEESIKEHQEKLISAQENHIERDFYTVDLDGKDTDLDFNEFFK